MNLTKLHYLSGLILTLFIGLHLFNHLCSMLGASAHITIMDALRPLYRNPFSETLLLGAVVVQIVSGLLLFKTARKMAVSNFDKLHIRTGLYLAFFLLIHVNAVLIGRYLLGLDTNFYFGVAGLNTFPFSLFFVPYYALAIFSFFGHIASVHHKKMKHHFLGLAPYTQSKGMVVFGILVTIVIFYGLTNHFRGVAIPKEYGVLIGK